MPTTHEVDIRKLETHITELEKSLANLARAEDWKRLIPIIHRPGWTTPAEYLFANAILEAMKAHTTALTNLKTQLLHASEAVVK